VDPDPVPTEEVLPTTDPTEPPEAGINEEVATALEAFDAEEIYTTPQTREPVPATAGDPDGISQFMDAVPQNNPYAGVNNSQAEPVVALVAEVREINIEKLTFEASDDPALAERYEMALLKRIEQMRFGMDSDANGDKVEVQIFVGATTSLTVGIVSWVLRGGSLLASLMSTVPLLNRFDPLPILKSRNDEEDVEPDDDDDDTETTGPVDEGQKRVDNMFNDNQSGQASSEHWDE
jgi:hypothetical protein